jgi:hypothetical protein
MQHHVLMVSMMSGHLNTWHFIPCEADVSRMKFMESHLVAVTGFVYALECSLHFRPDFFDDARRPRDSFQRSCNTVMASGVEA